MFDGYANERKQREMPQPVGGMHKQQTGCLNASIQVKHGRMYEHWKITLQWDIRFIVGIQFQINSGHRWPHKTKLELSQPFIKCSFFATEANK